MTSGKTLNSLSPRFHICKLKEYLTRLSGELEIRCPLYTFRKAVTMWTWWPESLWSNVVTRKSQWLTAYISHAVELSPSKVTAKVIQWTTLLTPAIEMGRRHGDPLALAVNQISHRLWAVTSRVKIPTERVYFERDFGNWTLKRSLCCLAVRREESLGPGFLGQGAADWWLCAPSHAHTSVTAKEKAGSDEC